MTVTDGQHDDRNVPSTKEGQYARIGEILSGTGVDQNVLSAAYPDLAPATAAYLRETGVTTAMVDDLQVPLGENVYAALAAWERDADREAGE